jgi:hypothetical protein
MAKSTNPFRYFDSSPEVIRLVVSCGTAWSRSRGCRRWRNGARMVKARRRACLTSDD